MQQQYGESVIQLDEDSLLSDGVEVISTCSEFDITDADLEDFINQQILKNPNELPPTQSAAVSAESAAASKSVRARHFTKPGVDYLLTRPPMVQPPYKPIEQPTCSRPSVQKPSLQDRLGVPNIVNKTGSTNTAGQFKIPKRPLPTVPILSETETSSSAGEQNARSIVPTPLTYGDYKKRVQSQQERTQHPARRFQAKQSNSWSHNHRYNPTHRPTYREYNRQSTSAFRQYNPNHQIQDISNEPNVTSGEQGVVQTVEAHPKERQIQELKQENAILKARFDELQKHVESLKQPRESPVHVHVSCGKRGNGKNKNRPPKRVREAQKQQREAMNDTSSDQQD